MKLKITLTETYADKNPAIPQLKVVEGQMLDIPGDVSERMAKRIVELEGGELVTEANPKQEESIESEETEDAETESDELAGTEAKVLDVESKEKPKRRRVRREEG